MATSKKPDEPGKEIIIKQSDLDKLSDLRSRINKGEDFDSAAFNKLFTTDTAKFLQNLAISQVALPISHLPFLSKDVIEMDDILTKQCISTYRQEIVPLVVTSSLNNN